MGVVLGFAGLLLRAAIGDALDTVFVVVVTGALLYAAAVDLGRAARSAAYLGAPNPGTWPCSMGHYPGIFAWGFDLGIGSHDAHPVPVAPRRPARGLPRRATGDAVAITTVYGAARALAVVAAVSTAANDDFRRDLRCDPEPGAASQAPRRRDGPCNCSPDRDFLAGREGGERGPDPSTSEPQGQRRQRRVVHAERDRVREQP